MRIWLAVVAVLLVMRAPAALADRDPQSGAPLPPGKQPTPSPISDHFALTGAFYYPLFHTTLRADPTQSATVINGTTLSAEHYLGMQERPAMGLVEAMLRPRERSKLRLDFFEQDRDGSVLLASPVVFGNQVFAAGQQLQSTLNWRMVTVTYTYSFYRSERLEIGTGLAVYALDMSAQLQVLANSQQQTETASGAAPALPLDVSWLISRRFSFNAHGAYFKANVHNFDGSLTDLHTDCQFRWTPNFATGFGYSSVRTSLTRTSGSNPGYLNESIKGPQAFLRFSF